MRNSLSQDPSQKMLTEKAFERRVLDQVKPRTKSPHMFEVILLNDDSTPMDFVVFVLKKLFHKSEEQARALMWAVHTKGQGLCGLYTRDVAETKMIQVINLARDNGHPLRCIIRQD